jgi:SRSO17 transposase
MKMPVVLQASPDVLPELAPSLASFAPLFRRSTSRASVERSLTGLLTDLERKNCDTSAAAVAGTAPARWQPLLTEAAWDPQALDRQRVTALVAQSPPHGLLLRDDTGLPTHGRSAVGVARQYAGTLGQVANGQVVVSAHSVADEPRSSPPGHWPRTAPRSLPATWAAAHARRATVRVPTAVTVQTKPERALALVEQAQTWGVPCATVGADAGSGDHPPVLKGLDARQLASVVGVSSPCGVRLPEEVPAAARRSPPRPRGRGQPQKPRPAPLYAAKAGRDALPEARWQPSTGRERADVALRQQCVAVRAHWAPGGAQCSTRQHRVWTGPAGGLLGDRPVPGERGEVKGYDSHFPADTPLRRLVALAQSRWPIAPVYAEAQGACGLDHDQGRRGDGRHRHLALVMRA